MIFRYKVNEVDVSINLNGTEIPLTISGDFVPNPKILRIAWKNVRRSLCDRYKHAAVIFRNSEVVYATYNIQHKSHPNGSGPYQTVHAEVRAIRGAFNKRGYLGDCKIFVLRTNNIGTIKTSKPCKDCKKLIERYGLKVAWSEGEDVESYPESPLSRRLKETYGT